LKAVLSGGKERKRELCFPSSLGEEGCSPYQFAAGKWGFPKTVRGKPRPRQDKTQRTWRSDDQKALPLGFPQSGPSCVPHTTIWFILFEAESYPTTPSMEDKVDKKKPQGQAGVTALLSKPGYC